MATKLTFIFIFTLFTACSSGNDKRATEEDASATATDMQKETEAPTSELIQKMLDLPKWQWVYHPEVGGRLPVKVLKNDIVDDRFGLTKFNQKVQILSLMELEAQKTGGYVEIKELKFHGDTAHFVIEYPIEGAFANGYFLKKNGKWVVHKYTVGEY